MAPRHRPVPAQIIKIPYKPRKWARPFHDSFLRFAALVLHRRAGKTTAIINHHQRAALSDEWELKRLQFLKPDLSREQLKPLLRNRFYGHVMPSYKQAKLVVWEMLKHYASTIPGAVPNESELYVKYPETEHGVARVQLFGADSPDSLRGPAFSGLSFDEYSQQPPNIYGEVLSKALADHLGYAIFAGTIKGKNHLYRTHEAAAKNPKWFALWQTVDVSLATEEDVAIQMLEQAMADDRDMIAQGLTTQDEYDQEWFLSPAASIQGAFYKDQMGQALRQGRICRVPYDPMLPVDTDWDLGIDDFMSIWFTQSLRGGEVRVIDYYEVSGEGFPHFVTVLKDRGYTYGNHWAPHDISVRELGTGKSRLETAAALGLKFRITPKLEIDDGIAAARLLIPRCYFDEERCAAGIEALRNYKKTWNERMQEFTGTPVHNWASHGADAFRGLAVRHQTPTEKKPSNGPGQQPLRGPMAWAG